MTAATTVPVDRELNFTRIFDAPCELVFDAWTDPKQIVRWWGPIGFTTTTHEMDVRPGGVWRFVMHGPDGTDYKNKIIFLEVVKPARLVYKHSGDEDNDPVKFQVTATFTEQDGKTKITMRMLFDSAKERDEVASKYGAIEGANQTLERLAQHLAHRKGSAL